MSSGHTVTEELHISFPTSRCRPHMTTTRAVWNTKYRYFLVLYLSNILLTCDRSGRRPRESIIMFWLKSSAPSYSVLNVYSCTNAQRCLRAYATITPDTQDSGKLKNPYPYPKHNRPTPYQIFHLQSGATQAEIKSRCKSNILNYPPVHAR